MSRLLPTDAVKAAWFPAGRMSLSGIMATAILFHLPGCRCFKRFYRRAVQGPLLQNYFPRTARYNRLAELTEYSLMPLGVDTRYFRRGKGTGIGFIDSTPLKVCHNRRLYSHKVFSGYAARGKSSVGWFYGFKLHLTINDRDGMLLTGYAGN